VQACYAFHGLVVLETASSHAYGAPEQPWLAFGCLMGLYRRPVMLANYINRSDF
jgi:hypothetical protein